MSTGKAPLARPAYLLCACATVSSSSSVQGPFTTPGRRCWLHRARQLWRLRSRAPPVVGRSAFSSRAMASQLASPCLATSLGRIGLVVVEAVERGAGAAGGGVECMTTLQDTSCMC